MCRGGRVSTQTGINTLHAFDTKAGIWLTKAQMSKGRVDHSMEALDYKLYVIGGRDGHGHVSTIEIYDIQSEQWSIMRNTLSVYGGASIVDGKIIYITGGFRKGNNYSSGLTLLDSEPQVLGLQLYGTGFILPIKCAHHFCGRMIAPQCWQL